MTFLSLLLIRLHMRSLCPCESPATMRCSKHGSKLCSDPLCRELHRWAHNSWAKDTDPCLIQALRGPLDYSIYALAVIVVGLGLVLSALYLGVKL